MERKQLEIEQSCSPTPREVSRSTVAGPGRSRWNNIRRQFTRMITYLSIWRSRFLWFFTINNLVGMGVILFIAAVFKQEIAVISHEMLPRSGLVRYEKGFDNVDMVDSVLKRFHELQKIQQDVQYGKLQEIEKFMKLSISSVRSEIKKLRAEMDSIKNAQEDVSNAFVKVSADFRSQVAAKLAASEEHMAKRLAEVESRIAKATERMHTTSNTCPAVPPAGELMAAVPGNRKKNALNLASRSHGAFVVSHLTSKPVISGSVVYNFIGKIFGLETYNFAITERSYIMPSEAFCFEGIEGKITIRLWSNSSVKAVEYEHDYWHDVVPISAPQQYEVMACLDRDCVNTSLLGECRYPVDEKRGPAQICDMQNRSVSTDQVQIIFRTNHGQEYTCIYQLKVLYWK